MIYYEDVYVDPDEAELEPVEEDDGYDAWAYEDQFAETYFEGPMWR